jgi:hypothetical protein
MLALHRALQQSQEGIVLGGQQAHDAIDGERRQLEDRRQPRQTQIDRDGQRLGLVLGVAVGHLHGGRAGAVSAKQPLRATANPLHAREDLVS